MPSCSIVAEVKFNDRMAGILKEYRPFKKNLSGVSQHPRGEPSISFNLYQEKCRIGVFPSRRCEKKYN